MNHKTITEALTQFSSKTVLVVGDLMLDAYIWGDAMRISPEAPVPVVKVKSQEFMPGGAANVTRNLRGLDANVIAGGIVGEDPEGEQLVTLLHEVGIHSDSIIRTEERPTSVKTRIIARNQHVVRYDREYIATVSEEIQSRLFGKIEDQIESLDGLIIEDYGKGLFSAEFIKQLIEIAGQQNIPVFIDPKKRFFEQFTNVRLLKPNWKEFLEAVGPFDSEEDFLASGEAFRLAQNVESLLVTRGSDGMTLFNKNGTRTIPTHARRVHDVSGAGDTVIATYTLANICGLSDTDAVALANLAAGIVCEEVGVVPITLSKLGTRLNELISASE